MKKILLGVAFVLSAQLPAAVSAKPDFVFDRVTVNQVNSAVFEAIPRGSAGTGGLWCAASEYAVRKLDANWRQDLYVVRGYAQSVTTGRPTSVQFTLDPQAAGVTPQPSGFGSGIQSGANVTVQMANTRCNRNSVGND